MTQTPRSAAFFDVDETIIAVKSMRDFLNFYGAHRGGLPTWESFIEALPRGTGREDTNRAYYEIWRGLPRDEVMAWGALWFRGVARKPGFYIHPVLERLATLREAGSDIVLVSGSFDAILNPVAHQVGATAILCSSPEFENGRYTGTVQAPMIGSHKAQAALAYCERYGIDPGDCLAFGDHETDRSMLEAVGTGFWAREHGRLEPFRRRVRT